MSTKKVSDLTALTTVASDDLLIVVDISDTTDAVTGTTKKITRTNLISGLANYSDTTANFTGTLQNGGSNVLVDSDIDSTVQSAITGITTDAVASLTTDHIATLNDTAIQSIEDATLAAGDILYALNTDQLTTLNVGTSGQVLSLTSDQIPAWADAAGGGGATTYYSTISSDVTLTESDAGIYYYFVVTSGNLLKLPSSPSGNPEFIFNIVGTTADDEFIEVVVGTDTVSGAILRVGQRLRCNYINSAWHITGNGFTNIWSSANTWYGTNTQVTIGSDADGTSNGVAVGYGADASSNGAAVGYNATGDIYGAVVGRGAYGNSHGVCVGYNTSGNAYGVAIGDIANGDTNGVAVGASAHGDNSCVAVGANANSTGTNAVAIGRYVQSTGTSSIAIGGGTSTSNSANATSSQCTAIGYNTLASNSNATAVGQSSEATGAHSLAVGNTALAAHTGATCIGYNAESNENYEFAFGSGHSSYYGGLMILNASLSTTTPTALTCTDGASYFSVDSGAVFAFTIHVSARNFTSGACAAYQFVGGIKNISGTTSLIGTVTKTIIGEDNASYDCDVTANDTNDRLEVTVTGADTNSTAWVARIDFVRYG